MVPEAFYFMFLVSGSGCPHGVYVRLHEEKLLHSATFDKTFLKENCHHGNQETDAEAALAYTICQKEDNMDGGGDV